MKLGILFNCQHFVLSEVARRTLPGTEIIDYDLGPLRHDDAKRQVALAELATCDQVLALKLGADYGELASDAIRPFMRRLTLLPAFSFGGFHPDMIYVPTPEGYLYGFTHHYHSRIALAGFLSGRSVNETISLYNALVMARAGYFHAYAHEMSLACSLYDPCGIDLRPMFERWARRGCFMHSINHPKSWCNAELCLAMLRYAELLGDVELDFDSIPDPLLIHPTHPVLPPLASRLGVQAGTGFKPFHPTEDHSVPLERFVELEYDAFMAAGTEPLNAAPGVAGLRGVIG